MSSDEASPAGKLLVFGALVCAAGYSLNGRSSRGAAAPASHAAANGRARNGSRGASPRRDQWAAVLAPGCLAHHIQLPYALKWIDLESGGNPCAVGYPSARGPDGNPLELGIAQFYNPDDLGRLGLSGTQLRAYCVPGDDHAVKYRGRRVRGFSQALLRPLTAAEMQTQADGAIGLIARSMASATRDLAGVNAGAAWSPATRDYWTLVKLQHGLPRLSRSGLPAVSRFLARAPHSWQEFRAALAHVALDKETARKRELFPAILNNAERCASVFAESEIA